MNREITISELARIMNVSVHQIRYFEEKNILQPAYIDDNKYRMYDMDQVYELAQILLLRKLGVSVPSIKQAFATLNDEQFEQLLHHSLQETASQIEKLQELQQLISKVLQEQRNFSGQTPAYEVKQREAARLKRWIKMEEPAALDARLLAELATPIPNLFESDIHFLYESSDAITLCLENQQSDDLILPAGDYLSARFLIEHEDELVLKIEQFYGHAAAHFYTLTGPLILIEKSYLSLFSQGKLHVEILQKIESTGDKGGNK